MAKTLTDVQIREVLRMPEGIGKQAFVVLRSIAKLANDESRLDIARDLVLRALEHRERFGKHSFILDALAREAGYFPYINPESLGFRDSLAYEFHRPLNSPDIVFHREQAAVYRRLLDGDSVILSAPTSFGKSKIIDAMIATGKFKNIAVIVPTLALIDETRRRLSVFRNRYKVITHLSQSPAGRNIFVLTAERAGDYEHFPPIEFLVVDEFYKLNALDEDTPRTVALNQAFYKLRKPQTQFYLLGPNIREIPEHTESAFHCHFFKTTFATVAAESRPVRGDGDELDRLVNLAKSLDEPTLIFCRSPARVNEVAHKFLASGVGVDASALQPAADWASAIYHPDWVFGKALVAGIGIHHGRLPRALSQYVVRAFNDLKLRFLICTTTLIEGVNTKAKNVIIFDNKVVRRKLDFFTFNNIKGRSGRMFTHFVGRVFLFHDAPVEQLPFVDFPLLTQDERVPESLLIQISDPDLSSSARERLKPFGNQTVLPMDVLRKNSGIDPQAQLNLARKIEQDPDAMSAQLAWTGFPTYDQLKFACELIWEHLIEEGRKAGISSGAQLAFKTIQLQTDKQVSVRVMKELTPGKYAAKSPDEAVERVLEFDRAWAGFELPRLLRALSKIQESVLRRLGKPAGNYSVYAAQVECLFRNPVVAALDEYGVPLQTGEKLQQVIGTTDDLDEALERLKRATSFPSTLTAFERELVQDAQSAL